MDVHALLIQAPLLEEIEPPRGSSEQEQAYAENVRGDVHDEERAGKIRDRAARPEKLRTYEEGER